jgi:hypothetical protein
VEQKALQLLAGMPVPDDFRLTGLAAFAMPFINSITREHSHNDDRCFLFLFFRLFWGLSF